MTDIIEQLSNPATHKRLRWHEVNISNPESPDKTLTALAQWIPINANNERVAGAAERDSNRDVNLTFDTSNEKHMQLYVLLEEILREADAAKQTI
jgi:hypothetical protein